MHRMLVGPDVEDVDVARSAAVEIAAEIIGAVRVDIQRYDRLGYERSGTASKPSNGRGGAAEAKAVVSGIAHLIVDLGTDTASYLIRLNAA